MIHLNHTSGMDHNELLTSRQVAERVGRTITTVNRWVDDGKLTPAVTLPGYNGQRLFDPATVDALRGECVS